MDTHSPFISSDAKPLSVASTIIGRVLTIIQNSDKPEKYQSNSYRKEALNRLLVAEQILNPKFTPSSEENYYDLVLTAEEDARNGLMNLQQAASMMAITNSTGELEQIVPCYRTITRTMIDGRLQPYDYDTAIQDDNRYAEEVLYTSSKRQREGDQMEITTDHSKMVKRFKALDKQKDAIVIGE